VGRDVDGYVNAEIRPQVAGYIIKQKLHRRFARPQKPSAVRDRSATLSAALDRAKGDLAQAQAQLGKSTLDVERDTPLAEARPLPRAN